MPVGPHEDILMVAVERLAKDDDSDAPLRMVMSDFPSSFFCILSCSLSFSPLDVRSRQQFAHFSVLFTPPQEYIKMKERKQKQILIVLLGKQNNPPQTSLSLFRGEFRQNVNTALMPASGTFHGPTPHTEDLSKQANVPFFVGGG